MGQCLIKDAQIYDGSGQLPFSSDVLLAEGRIASIKQEIDGRDSPTIYASGMALAPGFINLHSHSDLEVFQNKRMPHAIGQGITTEIVGQDGFSVAPVKDGSVSELARTMTHLAGDVQEEFWWRSFDQYLAAVKMAEPAVRIEGLVGNGTLRIGVMGSSSQQPRASELLQMKEDLAGSMEGGARGLSLGLVYPPSSYAQLDELIALCKVVAHYDGLLMVHMRDEGDGIFDSIHEIGKIGQESGVRVNISHLKVLGPKNWGKMESALQIIQQLQAEGLDITFDHYPYTASCTGLKVIVPQWAYDGGEEAFLRRLEDRNSYEKICREVLRHIEDLRGGAQNIQIASTTKGHLTHIEGERLDSIAEEMGLQPAPAALQLLKQDGGIVAVYFSMDTCDLERAMMSPLQGICSDGIVGAKPHPRTYGAFPRVLGYYSRERGLMKLEEAIRKMTMEPARRLRLWDRGLIREGLSGDLVLFDPETIGEGNTFLDPKQYPTGILGVWVKGENMFFQRDQVETVGF